MYGRWIMDDYPDKSKRDDDEDKKQNQSKDKNHGQDEASSLVDDIDQISIDETKYQQAIKRAYQNYLENKEGKETALNNPFSDGKMVSSADTLIASVCANEPSRQGQSRQLWRDDSREPVPVSLPETQSEDPAEGSLSMLSTSRQDEPLLPIRYTDKEASSSGTRPVGQSAALLVAADINRGTSEYVGDYHSHYSHTDPLERADGSAEDSSKPAPEDGAKDKPSTPRKRKLSDSDVPEFLSPSKRPLTVNRIAGTRGMVEMHFKFGNYFVTKVESDTQETLEERPPSPTDPKTAIQPSSDENMGDGSRRRSRDQFESEQFESEQFESEQDPSDPNPRSGKWKKFFDLFYKRIPMVRGVEPQPCQEKVEPYSGPVYVEVMGDDSTLQSPDSTPSPPRSPQEHRYEFPPKEPLTQEFDAVSTTSACRTLSSDSGRCLQGSCITGGHYQSCVHRPSYSRLQSMESDGSHDPVSRLQSMESGGIHDPASRRHSTDSGIEQGADANPDNGGEAGSIPGPSGVHKAGPGVFQGSVRPKVYHSPRKGISQKGKLPLSPKVSLPMKPSTRRQSTDSSSPEIQQDDQAPGNQGPEKKEEGNGEELVENMDERETLNPNSVKRPPRDNDDEYPCEQPQGHYKQ